MIIDEFISTLKTGLEEYAATAGDARTFHIFKEAGERGVLAFNAFEQRTTEEMLSEVYATLYVTPSQMLPIKGLTVLNISATLEVLVDVNKTPVNDEGHYPELDYILSLLERFTSENNGETYIADEDNKNFSVTVNYSPATASTWRLESSLTGEIVPVSVSIYLRAVENGVSSNDITIKIDNEEVFFESCVFTRNKVVEPYTYTEDAPTKSTAIQHGFGVDLVLPLINSTVGTKIINEVLDGSLNTPHTVYIKIGNERYRVYNCIFGNSSLSGQVGKNVGVTVSFVEYHEMPEPSSNAE
jgi:hypothetical protein